MNTENTSETTTHSDPKDLVIAKLIELFGEDNIADPEIFPKVFESQVKMAKYQIFLDTPPSTEITIEGEPEMV